MPEHTYSDSELEQAISKADSLENISDSQMLLEAGFSRIRNSQELKSVNAKTAYLIRELIESFGDLDTPEIKKRASTFYSVGAQLLIKEYRKELRESWLDAAIEWRINAAELIAPQDWKNARNFFHYAEKYALEAYKNTQSFDHIQKVAELLQSQIDVLPYEPELSLSKQLSQRGEQTFGHYRSCQDPFFLVQSGDYNFLAALTSDDAPRALVCLDFATRGYKKAQLKDPNPEWTKRRVAAEIKRFEVARGIHPKEASWAALRVGENALEISDIEDEEREVYRKQAIRYLKVALDPTNHLALPSSSSAIQNKSKRLLSQLGFDL
jgi:hypothetical protein